MKLADICSLISIMICVRSASESQDAEIQPVVQAIPEEDNNDCSICLADYRKQSYRTLICGHKYCGNCILRLIGDYNNDSCPACRAVVALSLREARTFASLGFKFFDEVLAGPQPGWGKFFITVPENTNPHAFSALLRLCKEVVEQRAQPDLTRYSLFVKEHLYDLLRIVSTHKLEGTLLYEFITNFKKSLSKLTRSEISTFIVQKTTRESLIALLEPVFGKLEHVDREPTSFTYSDQKDIKIYILILAS